MSTAAEEKREDKIGHIGQEIVYSFPLGGTATTDLISPSLYPAEERPTKKCTAQHIGCRITTTKTASRLDYWTRDCSSGLRH